MNDPGLTITSPSQTFVPLGRYNAQAGRTLSMLPSDEDTRVVPVLEETARVELRNVETGRVSLHKTVRERDEVVETLLRSHAIDVERVRVDRVVETPPVIREEGDLLIVPVLEEILVVEKRLVLREEIRIRRTEETRPGRECVRLRTEEVAITRSPPLHQPEKEKKPDGNL